VKTGDCEALYIVLIRRMLYIQRKVAKPTKTVAPTMEGRKSRVWQKPRKVEGPHVHTCVYVQHEQHSSRKRKSK